MSAHKKSTFKKYKIQMKKLILLFASKKRKTTTRKYPKIKNEKKAVFAFVSTALYCVSVYPGGLSTIDVA